MDNYFNKYLKYKKKYIASKQYAGKIDKDDVLKNIVSIGFEFESSNLMAMYIEDKSKSNDMLGLNIFNENIDKNILIKFIKTNKNKNLKISICKFINKNINSYIDKKNKNNTNNRYDDILNKLKLLASNNINIICGDISQLLSGQNDTYDQDDINAIKNIISIKNLENINSVLKNINAYDVNNKLYINNQNNIISEIILSNDICNHLDLKCSSFLFNKILSNDLFKHVEFKITFMKNNNNELNVYGNYDDDNIISDFYDCAKNNIFNFFTTNCDIINEKIIKINEKSININNDLKINNKFVIEDDNLITNLKDCYIYSMNNDLQKLLTDKTIENRKKFDKLFKPQVTIGIKYDHLIKILLYLSLSSNKSMNEIYNYDGNKFDNKYYDLHNIYVNDYSEKNYIKLSPFLQIIRSEFEAIKILNEITLDTVWKNTMLNWTTYIIYLMHHETKNEDEMYDIDNPTKIFKDNIVFPCRNRMYDILPIKDKSLNRLDVINKYIYDELDTIDKNKNDESDKKKIINNIKNLRKQLKKIDDLDDLTNLDHLFIRLRDLYKNLTFNIKDEKTFFVFFGKNLNGLVNDDKMNYGPDSYGETEVPKNEDENIVVVEFRKFSSFTHRI